MDALECKGRSLYAPVAGAMEDPFRGNNRQGFIWHLTSDVTTYFDNTSTSSCREQSETLKVIRSCDWKK